MLPGDYPPGSSGGHLRKLLTPLAIDKLTGTHIRREIADAGMPGLRLVIQPKPSASKSWCVRYRYGGRSRKLTLGPYPRVDLVKARQRTKDALEAVERGEDPAATKKAASALQHLPEADRDCFGVLIRQFFHSHAIPKTRSWPETARLLGLQIDPDNSAPAKPPLFKDVPDRIAARWAERPVTGIRRRDIIGLLEESKARGATTTANRELAALSKFFSWCVARDIIDASPAVGISKPAPENRRTRILSDSELRLVWLAAEAEGYPFGDIVRELILTAQRRNEVAGASRPEIKHNSRAWILPPERTKNGREHFVPLSDPALAILTALPRFTGPYLFGAGGEKPFSGFSKAKKRLNERINKLASDEAGQPVEIPNWTLHDLRRTAATGMSRLGVLPHVIEAILNHISGTKAGVAGIYNLWTYEVERREALEMWAKHVAALSTAAKESFE